MAYFTHIQSGEAHEPKTSLCIHHSYDESTGTVNIFSYEVFKEDKNRIAQDITRKWSEDAIRHHLKVYLYRYGVEKSEKY